MFSATIHADTYQATREPFHREAYWAIVKEGTETEVRKLFSPSSIVDMTTAGDGGNREWRGRSAQCWSHVRQCQLQ